MSIRWYSPISQATPPIWDGMTAGGNLGQSLLLGLSQQGGGGPPTPEPESPKKHTRESSDVRRPPGPRSHAAPFVRRDLRRETKTVLGTITGTVFKGLVCVLMASLS